MQQSTSIVFKGRVSELWSEKDHAFLELVVGANRLAFSTSVSDLLSSVRRGDLVSLSATPSHEISSITSMSGPCEQAWTPLSDSMRWRRTTGSPSRMDRLWRRQECIREIREDLYGQGFLEAETPLLVKGTCPDTHIESIQAGDGYLVTSTEYQIKRMMVGGFEKVFTLTKNFRANDRGRFHSTEFTMLEWARAFGTLQEIEEDAIRFIRRAFQKLFPNRVSFSYQGNEIQILELPWERLTVCEAFEKYLNLMDLQDFSLEVLCAASDRAGIELPTHFRGDKHLVLSYLLDLLQPHLGFNTPTFLREWPAFMTSSAQLSSHDSRFAERSELYVAGIEIADGFPFLTDSHVQRDSFDRELLRRKEEGKSVVTVDDRYVEALAEGIPPGAGMALGVDRLVMVLTDSAQLADVQPFSWDEI